MKDGRMDIQPSPPAQPPRPRLVLASCDASHFHAGRLGALAEPITLEDRGGEVWLALEHGAPAPLVDGIPHRPGAPLAGMLAFSAAGAAMLRRLMADAHCAGAFGELEFLQLDTRDPGFTLAAWLNARLLRELDRGARRLALAHQELAELRAGYAEMTEQFATVEAFVSEYASVPLLVFSNAADGGMRTSQFPALGPAGVLRQTLPVKSTGLAAFELFFPPRDPEAEGAEELRVELLTAEDDTLLASWRVTDPGSRPGWMGFVLGRGVTGPARTPLVRITVSRGLGPPDLGLGRPNPVARACLASDHGGVVERSLALKIWAGLPGIRPPALEVSAPLHGELPARQICIPNSCFLQAELVSEPPAGLNFDLVMPLNGGKELQIHPLEARATLARLPAVLPGQAGFAFAEMRRGHADAPEMEVAAMCDAPAEQIAAWLAGESPACGFSGWTRLCGPGALRLGFTLSGATPARRDVVIAVRLAPGCTSAYAWARLLRLGFEPA